VKHQRTFISLAILVGMIAIGCTGTVESATTTPSFTPTLTPEVIPAETATLPAFQGMRVDALDCKYGGEFNSIAAIDEFTVKFTLCYPDPAFLSRIAFTAFSIQPLEHLAATGGSPLENPIGTGPYMVEKWERGQQLVLQAFPDYWGEQPQLRTLVFRWNADAVQRLFDLQSGRADGIANVELTNFEAIRNNPNFQLIEYTTLNVMYFGFNNDPLIEVSYDMDENPFANEKVRQALAMGIDRERIVANFYPPGSQVAAYFTPCAIPNGCLGAPWYEFAPKAAKTLLDEAGYRAGFKTKIYYRNVPRPYVPRPKEVVEDLKIQLKENLNIDAEITEMKSIDFLGTVASGHLDGIHLHGWEMIYPDQTNFLDYHFGTDESLQFGETFDDITDSLAQAALLVGEAERAPFYITANNAIRQHVPMIPVAWAGGVLAYKVAVQGAHASPLSDEKFARMALPGQDTFVWLQSAEPASLYCPDETDGDSLRACGQIVEALYGYTTGGAAVQPVLAEECQPNDELTVWTCSLRQEVKFHDGSLLDANDVVASFVAQWDAGHPLHTGRTGAFTFMNAIFGEFLNLPAE
jgi:ABC-type transport system substrate-binding protein